MCCFYKSTVMSQWKMHSAKKRYARSSHFISLYSPYSSLNHHHHNQVREKVHTLITQTSATALPTPNHVSYWFSDHPPNLLSMTFLHTHTHTKLFKVLKVFTTRPKFLSLWFKVLHDLILTNNHSKKYENYNWYVSYERGLYNRSMWIGFFLRGRHSRWGFLKFLELKTPGHAELKRQKREYHHRSFTCAFPSIWFSTK